MSDRPLGGTTVVLTRRPEDNAALACELRHRGAGVLELPSVRTEPLSDTRELATALATLGSADVLVLTSRAGAAAVAALMPGDRLPCGVAAVGAASAQRAASHGLRVTFVASRPDAATLARELPLPRGDVVLARSDLADAEPVAILRERGARVRDIVAYRTIVRIDGDIEPVERALRRSAVTIVVASPSAVDAVIDALGPDQLRRGRFVAIGPRTSARVRERLGCDPLVALGADPAAILRVIPAPTREEAIT